MSKHVKTVVIATVLVIFMQSPGQALIGGTGGVVYDPTNHIENIAIALQTAEIVTQNLQMIEQGFLNLEILDTSILAPLLADLQRFQRIMDEAQSLAFSVTSIASAFEQLYPTAETLEGISGPIAIGARVMDTQTRNSVLDAMRVQQVAADTLTADLGRLQTSLSASAQAVGNLMATQASNEIAAQIVEQLLGLKQLTMTYSHAMSSFLAAMVSSNEAARATAEHLMTNWPR